MGQEEIKLPSITDLPRYQNALMTLAHPGHWYLLTLGSVPYNFIHYCPPPCGFRLSDETLVASGHLSEKCTA